MNDLDNEMDGFYQFRYLNPEEKANEELEDL